jgi:hypothetical protein
MHVTICDVMTRHDLFEPAEIEAHNVNAFLAQPPSEPRTNIPRPRTRGRSGGESGYTRDWIAGRVESIGARIEAKAQLKASDSLIE